VVGYKVHLIEICDVAVPRVTVNIATTPATTPDDNISSVIHKTLKKRKLLLAESD
jgi:hypothetical protein